MFDFGSGHGLESSKRNRGAAVEADVIGEQQLKRTQSGSSSSSRSGRDREQQLKRMQAASSRRNREAAAEQQLKWMPQSGPGAAAEVDAIASVCTESCPAPDYTR